MQGDTTFLLCPSGSIPTLIGSSILRSYRAFLCSLFHLGPLDEKWPRDSTVLFLFVTVWNLFLIKCQEIVHFLKTQHSLSQWRSQDLILGGGGGKNNVRGSEASEGGGGGCGEGGVPPPTVRAFCILMLLMVQFGAYARYFPRIARIYI